MTTMTDDEVAEVIANEWCRAQPYDIRETDRGGDPVFESERAFLTSLIGYLTEHYPSIKPNTPLFERVRWHAALESKVIVGLQEPFSQDTAQSIVRWWVRGLPPHIRSENARPVFETRDDMLGWLAWFMTIHYDQVRPDSKEYGLVTWYAMQVCRIVENERRDANVAEARRELEEEIAEMLAGRLMDAPQVVEWFNQPEMLPLVAPRINRKPESKLPKDRVVLSDVQNWIENGRLPIPDAEKGGGYRVNKALVRHWLIVEQAGGNPLISLRKTAPDLAALIEWRAINRRERRAGLLPSARTPKPKLPR